MIKRMLILFAMPLFMVLFQVADHESEKGRDYQKHDSNRACYPFYDPYTDFTKNGDVFRKTRFDKSEMGKSTILTPAFHKIGKRTQNRR